MNQQQADKIIEVIRQDANGRMEWFPTEDTACVLGGLWLAMGRSQEEANTMGDAGGAVEREYQLPPGGLVGLVLTNDSHSDTALRRAALITLVNSWVQDVA